MTDLDKTSILTEPVPPPDGVKYALTVPQSVLFADLSLRGNRRDLFRAAMRIDYEPAYIIIDNGAMSWNYDRDEQFISALTGARTAAQAISRFIATMEITTRNLDRVSRYVPTRINRRPSVVEDLIQDLKEYWHAYQLQMTSLFTFWNVEYLLSSELTRALERIGRDEDIKQGLTRFLQPYEVNYFALERQQLEKLTRRFFQRTGREEIQANQGIASASLINALEFHSKTFGFLLSPFNTGAPPSIDHLLERMKEIAISADEIPDPASVNRRVDWLEDLPIDVRELGILAQRFTFWKSERLDMLSLADARAHDLYEDTAAAISLPLEELFTMTSSEIVESLKYGSPVTDNKTRRRRREAYCLLLRDGEIAFHRPTQKQESTTVTGAVGTVIKGITASTGRTSGRARVIVTLEDLRDLELGDVLVTTMTRPEMGAALDRACAFVTDEGGLMCHAAIISREMGKPCVIGTENATSLVRSGMFLNVNADEGTVTIIDVPQEDK